MDEAVEFRAFERFHKVATQEHNRRLWRAHKEQQSRAAQREAKTNEDWAKIKAKMRSVDDQIASIDVELAKMKADEAATSATLQQGIKENSVRNGAKFTQANMCTS
jgi:hypothetical protein